jgi:hypothetical protein
MIFFLALFLVLLLTPAFRRSFSGRFLLSSNMVDGVNTNEPYSGGRSIMNGALAAGDAATILPIDSIVEIKGTRVRIAET